jgi:hypothetical protein
MVQLDESGITVMKTPLSSEILHKEGLEDVLKGTSKCPSFSPVRGLPQGDVGSGDGWCGFFDILLRALESCGATPMQTRKRNYEMKDIFDTAYVDDLIASSATIEDLQLKADVISAFAIIFQLEIAIKKLRIGRAQFGVIKRKKESLIIYKSGWIAHEVVFSDDGHIKYLGTEYDIDDTNKTQFKETMAYLKSICDRILLARAKKNLKIAVLSTSVIAKVKYTSKFCSFSLNQYQKMEKVISKTYRRILGKMDNYPSQLLYGDRQRGAHNLVSLVDEIHFEKWSMLQRAWDLGGQASDAASALLERVARAGGTDMVNPATKANVTDTNEIYWATSLVQWCKMYGFELTRGGQTVAKSLQGNNTHENDLIQRYALFSDFDISVVRDGSRVWDDELIDYMKSEEIELGNMIQQHIQQKEPMQVVTVMPFQSWLVFNDVVWGNVVEVLGIKGAGYSVAIWEPETKLSKTRLMQLQPGVNINYKSRIFGAGSELILTHEQLFNGDLFRVICCQNGGSPLQRTIVRCTRDVRPAEWRIHGYEEVAKRVGPTIFTDGSWKDVSHPIEKVFQLPPSQLVGGGAVVMINDIENWRNEPILCTRYKLGGNLVPSVYPIEGMMVYQACQRLKQYGSGGTIYTDCESVVKASDESKRGSVKDCGIINLLREIRQARTSGIKIQHIRAHAERRSESIFWSSEEWGNYIADRVAEGDYYNPNFAGLELIIDEKELWESTEELFTKHWHITIDGHPIVTTLRSLVSKKRMDIYLKHRQETGESKRWVDSTLQLSVKATKSIEHGAVTNLRFDKFYEMNRAKYQDPGEPCKFCGKEVSLEHLLTCESIEQNTIRMEYEYKARCVTEEEEIVNPVVHKVMDVLRKLENIVPVQVATSVFSKQTIQQVTEVFGDMCETDIKLLKILIQKRGLVKFMCLIKLYENCKRVEDRQEVKRKNEEKRRTVTISLDQRKISQFLEPIEVEDDVPVGSKRKAKPKTSMNAKNDTSKKKTRNASIMEYFRPTTSSSSSKTVTPCSVYIPDLYIDSDDCSSTADDSISSNVYIWPDG